MCLFCCAVTPPGHYTSTNDTQPCPDGQYRPGWVAADAAGACLACSPDGSILSMATDLMTVFKANGTETAISVKGTVNSCCKWLQTCHQYACHQWLQRAVHCQQCCFIGCIHEDQSATGDSCCDGSSWAGAVPSNGSGPWARQLAMMTVAVLGSQNMCVPARRHCWGSGLCV
jgi:hypothetical protein